MIVRLIIAGVAIAGAGVAIAGAIAASKSDEKIWNRGICPSCGRRWHTRHFYVRGGKSVLAIECRKCQRYSELRWYDPTEV